MQTIPVGSVLTYGDVAKEIKSAPRAVGGACGKNPLPVIIPCHRIIAANNGLGGFNSGNIFFGLNIKKWLLEHEGIRAVA
jgi:methylated-DNA-[protein]-cysteine S-methyltransferase